MNNIEYFGSKAMKAEGTSKVKKPAPSLWVIALVALVLLSFFGVAIGRFLIGDVAAYYWHRKDFNAELWRSQEEKVDNNMWPPRLCMVDDLIESGTLEGLRREEVINLLGTPHPKGFPGGAENCDIHYHLGPERGYLRVASEWLFIDFGEDDKVKRYWIGRG
ncbi:MAG: hypothetical protein ACYSU3_01515 [Planctomycetota bacterium]|jgi:hypothetical protein